MLALSLVHALVHLADINGGLTKMTTDFLSYAKILVPIGAAVHGLMKMVSGEGQGHSKGIAFETALIGIGGYLGITAVGSFIG